MASLDEAAYSKWMPRTARRPVWTGFRGFPCGRLARVWTEGERAGDGEEALRPEEVILLELLERARAEAA